MTVQYPPAFHLSFVAFVRVSSSLAIFLSFSLLCCPLLPLFLCVSILRRLAVCSTAQLMLCWCVLTICISGSSFLSTYSISCIISTTRAASNYIRPLPPCCLGTYKRSTSALGWCCPWMVSSFLVFLSNFYSSS